MKKMYKCDVTCSLPPSPLSQTVTPSRTPSPLERDVLYGRPLAVSEYYEDHWGKSGDGQQMLGKLSQPQGLDVGTVFHLTSDWPTQNSLVQ